MSSTEKKLELLKSGKEILLLLITPFHIRCNLETYECTNQMFVLNMYYLYKSKYMYVLIVFASVRCVNFSKCRAKKSFMKGVIAPFEKALLRLLERHYYAF